MRQIIEAKYIFVDNKFIKKSAILFNEKIIAIDRKEKLLELEPNAKVVSFGGNSVLYPGFINPHTHLEFSANSATLNYGSFIEWLYSIFEYRDSLVNNLTQEKIESAINQMLQSGVTTFGAISSFGADLKACKDAPNRVIYFNEVIGSSPAMVDALFNDFKMRLNESKELQDNRLYPAIAIHSPYSVHPILLREVIKIAKEQNLPLTAHFLESKAEREWLESNCGDFKELFEKFFKTSCAVNTIDSFLGAFRGIGTLFTHCTQATKDEIELINSNNSSIIHCPRSNRLLNCGKLDISNIKNLLLGTDGLSSNYSLSILDELKSALIMHTEFNPKELALKLIQAITTNASKALPIKVGKLEKDYFADFAIFELPNDLSDESCEAIALHTIINCNSAKTIYIGGDEVSKK